MAGVYGIMLFADVTQTFDRIERTASRLEFTGELAGLFSKASQEDIRKIVYLCQGVVAPQFEGIELGMGDKLAAQAVARVAGVGVAKVEAEFRKSGDLGEAAVALLGQKLQKSLDFEPLTVRKVHDNFLSMATASGTGSQGAKIKLLCELLANSSGREAKTIIRFCTDNMRIGIGEPTILDALSIVLAGDKSFRPEIERAFNLTSDLGLVAELAFEKNAREKITSVGPKPGNPIRPALAERLESGGEIVEKLGECAVEGKYDGFRLQVHRTAEGGVVTVYSRKQEKITHMFPELVEAARRNVKAREFILEGEAVGVDSRTGKILPFQVTVQRKRKHGVAEAAKKIPLKLFCFELLFLDGKDYTLLPYRERRKKLQAVVKPGASLDVADISIVKTGEAVEDFFNKSVDAGLEGIIAKDLSAPYAAGARKFSWIKLKKSYRGALADTVDVAIVGFYYGKGKRTKFGFGGVLTAAYEPKSGSFKTVAKVGSGFSEEQMAEFAEMLSKTVVREKPAAVDSLLEPDEWVRPEYVIEVNADEITESPVHTCAWRKKADGDAHGLALRFPRMVSLRTDKGPKDATTESEMERMFELQHRQGATTIG